MKLSVIDNHRSRFTAVAPGWQQRKMKAAVYQYQTKKNLDDNPTVLSLTKSGLKVKTDLAFGKSTESYVGHQIVQQGQFVFTPRDFDATPILCGVAETSGCISNLYIVFSVSRDIDARFLDYYLWGLKYGFDFFEKLSFGMRYSFNRTQFENIPLIYPNLPTQRAIADFLDRETARIDTLIEKKQRLVELVAPRFEALVHEARSCGEWQRFENCSRNVSRPIPNDANGTFVPLGLFNRGRGFFVKPEAAYDDLGDSSFYFVEKGDLVFSGQFAWEGAVGLVSSSEHGCVVSHRYPVYKGVAGVMSEYLYAYFRSHHGQFLMDNCSRGAAGRNRPLNTRVLHKEKIAIPSVSLQAEVAKVVSFEWNLKTKIAPSIDRLKEYRSALITSAVTGQIDVTKWTNAGTTDRQLDAIEEEFGA